MREWMHLLLAAASILIFATLCILLVWRCYRSKEPRGVNVDSSSPRTRIDGLRDGIARLHQGSPSLHHQVEQDTKRRASSNYYVFKRGSSIKPLFNWADHPSLITDAVENGWSRFGFTAYMTSPSTRSSLLGWCAVGDHGMELGTDISWEVCQGSADFMQRIRLNSGLKKVYVSSSNSSAAAASVIRTALPLPGPPLGNSAFPQEAYFEITIMYCRGSWREDQESTVNSQVKEGEKTKLIQEKYSVKANSDSLAHGGGSVNGISKIEELRLVGKDDGRGGEAAVWLSLGLSTGGSLPLKLPGSYPGSVGFNSNGSVFLDGAELVCKPEKPGWARPNKVIGCGFDPRQKKVFFTADAELVHVIHCKSEEFGSPLYPTIAANIDAQILVNFGQSAFGYAPANAQRTPNPCFIGPLVKSPALGYEDSKELFSMGRIDSQWLNRSSTKGTALSNGANYPAVDFDEESEADLFEIVLDGTGRSPTAPL